MSNQQNDDIQENPEFWAEILGGRNDGKRVPLSDLTDYMVFDRHVQRDGKTFLVREVFETTGKSRLCKHQGWIQYMRWIEDHWIECNCPYQPDCQCINEPPF